MNLRKILLSAALIAALLAPRDGLAFSERGGSGLIDVSHAYSLPIGRPLVSIYGNYYSNDFTPGTSRLFSFTPSVTLGLGGGFEASGSLIVEALSSPIEDGDFTRRFDFRRRSLTAAVRWTTDLGSPRLRTGLQGQLSVPIDENIRPGGYHEPDMALDGGLRALLSTNIGWFDFPVRVHANAGWWWSRNDGSYYFQNHPNALPLPAGGLTDNDVLSYGLAVEAGVRRAVVFVELTTEQLVERRDALAGQENLWRLTPGIRMQLGQNVGLTAGLSFDVSSNETATAFDPKDAYPATELRVGMTLGSIFSRDGHEARKRGRSWSIVPESDPEVAPETAPQAEPAAAAPVAVAPATPAPVAPAAVPGAAERELLELLESRLQKLETETRLQQLDTRLRLLEITGYGEVQPRASLPAPVLPAVPAPADSTAATDTTTAAPGFSQLDLLDRRDAVILERLAALQEELRADRADRVAAATSVPTPVAAVPEVTADAPAPDAAPTVEAAAVTPPEQTPVVEAAAVTPRVQTPVVEAAAVTPPAQSPVVKAVSAPPPAETAVVVPPAKPVEVTTPLATVVETSAPATAPAQTAPSPAAPAPTQVVVPGTRVPESRSAVVVTTPAPSPTVVTGAAATGRSADAGPGLDPELSGSPAVTIPRLDPELLGEPAPVPASASSTGPAPAASATVVSAAIDPGIVESPATEPTFSIAPGQTIELSGLDLGRDDPTLGAADPTVLATLSDELVRFPTVEIMVMVHGAGSDREAELARTSRQAASIADRLAGLGVPRDRIRTIGMGAAAPRDGEALPSSRVEIVRTR